MINEQHKAPFQTELTVILKNDDSTYKQKFCLYDAYKFQVDDEIVKDCLEQAKNGAKFSPDEINIRALLSFRP